MKPNDSGAYRVGYMFWRRSVLTLAMAAFGLCLPSTAATVRPPTRTPLQSAARSNASKVETILHAFHNTDGAFPSAALLTDASGAFYSTTTLGGRGCACGTVFKLTPSSHGYSETVLHSFQGGHDGENPSAGVISDSSGDFFGTLSHGGTTPPRCYAGCGAVFALSLAGSKYREQILYRFMGGQDGNEPLGGLVRDQNGVLYGTTALGGGTQQICHVHRDNSGCGIVYSLTPSGSVYKETVLHAFQGGADGENPSSTLLLGNGGVLYGTTQNGGSVCCGTVFALTPSGSGYTNHVLYSFGANNDGENPVAGLVAGDNGSFYGTTENGGGVPGCGASGCGTVFKLTPTGSSYTETVLYAFKGGGTDGSHPLAPVTIGPDGTLYGTTTIGGRHGVGTIFALMPSGSGGYTERIVYTFSGKNDGAGPESGLLIGTDGDLYGTAFYAGAGGVGVVFKVTP